MATTSRGPPNQAATSASGEPTDGSPAGTMTAYDRRLFGQAGDVITLVRDAGRADPELATVYGDARRRGDATRVEVFSSWPADTLREELTVATAVDVYGAICNIDVFHELTVERSWSADRVEQWWQSALVRELLRRGISSAGPLPRGSGAAPGPR